jgi:translation initiation factor 3 subunit I
VWFSHNGERLGTYAGNNGSVWTLDVDRTPSFFYCSLERFDKICTAESRFMISGAADNTLRLWAVSTGKCLYTWEFPTAVKRVAFNEEGTQVVCITEQRMGHQCAIRVFNINKDGDGTNRAYAQIGLRWQQFFLTLISYIESKEPLYMFNPIGSKATVCAFTLTPNVIITGHESGKVALFNVKSGEEIDNNERAHSDVVTDLQLSKDRTYCITSSKDKAARVCSSFSGFCLVF